jgi:hypothetical protein
MHRSRTHWTWEDVGKALPRDTRKKLLNAVYNGAVLPRGLLEQLCDAEDAEEDAGLEQPRA